MIYEAKAYAKINLSLDVVGKLNNGYHLIESIVLFISLCDHINIYKHNKFECACDDKNIPQDESNIVIKAAKLFFEHLNLKDGVFIKIKKNIPSQAGLGGGSADAASVLHLLNNMYNTKLTLNELVKIASLIGADVPAAIYGGCVLCEGFGEKISKLPNFFDLPIVICSPSTGVSTKYAYEQLDKTNIAKTANTLYLVKQLKSRNATKFLNNCYNVFENVIYLEEVEFIKKIMTDCGALSSHMTGSGSCIYGVFKDDDLATICVKRLRNLNFKTFLTKRV